MVDPSLFPRPGVAPAGHAVPRSSAVDSGGHLLSALAQGRVTWDGTGGRLFFGAGKLASGNLLHSYWKW